MRNQKDHVSRVIGLYLDSVDKEELNEQYFVDPALWAKDFLGIDFYWKQREISEAVVNNANVAIKAGHGVGKAALLTCLLPTPTGWTTIGDVQVGEYVLDEAGRPNKVTHKSPIWDMDAYDVSFDDGTRLRVNGPHEWNVLDLTARSRKDGTKSGVDDWRNYWHTTRSIETRELFDLGVTTTAGQKRWRIPTAAPLDLPDADLPIDPYLLGFWLGDGSSHCGNITIGETKFGLIDWLTDHGYSIRIKDYFKEKGSILITVDGLGDSLESLGVLRNKHIPMAYLRGGLKQRRELLAGLMDSDGFLMKSGAANAGIDLCHKRLSSDVYELLMTLGCKVFRSEGEAVYTLDGERHVTGTRYRMNWTPLENPFKLRGAGWDGSKAQRSRHTQRTIVAIDRVADEPTQCISVESDSHLYLMGDSFVPTHNSFWAAILACWWIDTRPIEKVFVASTAPSADQVTGVLWREIRKAHQLSHRRYTEYKRLKALGKDTGDLPDRPLPGYITQDNRWKDDQGNILGQGRKPPDNKAEDAFQGFHDGHVLALGDESCGLSEGMIDGLDNITSNSNSRRVLIGNPTNPASHFGKIFRENTGAWSFHTISIFDSPNFHGGGRCSCHKDEPLGLGMPEDALSKLTNQEYVDNKKREYGEDSPRYIARVLGEFAYDAGNTLFSEFDLAQAKNSVVFPDLEEPYVVLGVDIARMGQDSTYVYKSERGLVQATHPETGEALGYDLISEDTHEPIVGYKVRFLEKWKDAPFVTRKMPNGKEVEGTAERVHGLALAHGAKEVRVDASGFGQGVLDPLFVLCDGKYEIVEVYGSSTENIDRRAYHNERAFRFSEVRRMFFQGLIDVAPEDEDVIDELGGIIYDFSITSGGMLIEAKEAMKKRGVKSPDAADAFSYAAMNYDYLLGDPFRGYGRGDIIRGENENVPTSWEPSSLQYSW